MAAAWHRNNRAIAGVVGGMHAPRFPLAFGFALALAITSPVSAGPAGRAAVVTCADGARLYLWGDRAIPQVTEDRLPVGAQVRVLSGPRNPARVETYYELDVPTLHRSGDGDHYWARDTCIVFTE